MLRVEVAAPGDEVVLREQDLGGHPAVLGDVDLPGVDQLALPGGGAGLQARQVASDGGRGPSRPMPGGDGSGGDHHDARRRSARRAPTWAERLATWSRSSRPASRCAGSTTRP